MAMNRRRFIELIGAGAAGAAVAQTPTSSRPNIVFIHCHDLGQFLHCYGVKTVQTPNLDGLASSGVLFERSFCVAPQCSPSRASMFTGRYPHSNGVMGLTHGDFAWDLNPDERHLGQILRDAGYTTSGVGIIHETHSGPHRCGLENYSGEIRAKTAADAALAEISRLSKIKDKPFYLQVGFLEPHRLPTSEPTADTRFVDGQLSPDDSRGVTVPPYLRDTPAARLEIAELQGAVRHVDAQAGRILAALRETGVERSTLLVFTTDHGIAMPRAKCSLYDPGLEVTLLLRLPDRPGWHGGIRHRSMISNLDYVPTILDLLGLPIPQNLHGRSFAPLLDGLDYAAREVTFAEMTYHDYYDPRRAIRTETHKLIANFTCAPAFMDPSQSWRPRSNTVVPPNPALAFHTPLELYDIVADPHERKDLAALPQHLAVVNQLSERLMNHLVQTQDPILQGCPLSPLHERVLTMLRGKT